MHILQNQDLGKLSPLYGKHKFPISTHKFCNADTLVREEPIALVTNNPHGTILPWVSSNLDFF